MRRPPVYLTPGASSSSTHDRLGRRPSHEGFTQDDPAARRRSHRPAGGGRPGGRPPTLRRGQRVERERRQGGDRRVHLAGARPAERVAALRDQRGRRPRRAQRHPSPLGAVRVRRPCPSRGVGRRRRRSGGARRARAGPQAADGAVHRLHRRRRRERRGGLRARRSPRSRTDARRRVGSRWARRPRPRSSRRGSTTARTRPRCATPRTCRAPSRASGASRRQPVRVRDRLGERAAVRAPRRVAVPPRPAVPRHEPAVHAGLQRGEGAGRRRRHTSARTPDQTQIAEFWVESSPLAWNRIARTVAAERGLGAWQQARLFGLLDMAMADGYISSFDGQVPRTATGAR